MNFLTLLKGVDFQVVVSFRSMTVPPLVDLGDFFVNEGIVVDPFFLISYLRLLYLPSRFPFPFLRVLRIQGP